MTATHERLIRILEQGRSDIAFESEGMKGWGEGWNASIDNAIRAIQVDAELEPRKLAAMSSLVERADADTNFGDWTEPELREAFSG